MTPDQPQTIEAARKELDAAVVSALPRGKPPSCPVRWYAARTETLWLKVRPHGLFADAHRMDTLTREGDLHSERSRIADAITYIFLASAISLLVYVATG